MNWPFGCFAQMVLDTFFPLTTLTPFVVTLDVVSVHVLPVLGKIGINGTPVGFITSRDGNRS